MKEKRSNIVALGGMLAALSLVLMLLTRIIPFSEMALPAAAGVLLIAAVIEAGAGWAFIIYLAVGLLSAFFAFQNGAAVYYILFFGQYTIIKSFIERIPNRIAQWAVKLGAFNVCAIAVYYMTVFITGVSGDLLKYGLAPALALVNAFFIVYDLALSRLVVTYIHVIRRHFRR